MKRKKLLSTVITILLATTIIGCGKSAKTITTEESVTTEAAHTEHVWEDANYQQPSVCTVCGEVQGEPLKADFVTYGFECNAEIDQTYEYRTACYEAQNLTTVGQVTFSDYTVADNCDFFEVPEGYVCQAVTITYCYDDENAWQYGTMSRTCNEDYYDIVGHDDFMEYDGNDVGTCTRTFNGMDYAECHVYFETLDKGWKDTYYTYQTRVYNSVPEGYDGVVVGAYDAHNVWEDNMYIYDVADENSIFLRLPAAVIE